MIYTTNITTAKLTAFPPNKPKRTILEVTTGLVYKVEIDFPSGSAGLMGVAIADGGYQVWPSNVGQWFTGDNRTIVFDDTYLKGSAPHRFTIFTYNNDDTYDHLVIVRIGLVSREIFMARFLPHLSYKYLSETMGQLQQTQNELQQVQNDAVIKEPFTWLTDNGGN